MVINDPLRDAVQENDLGAIELSLAEVPAHIFHDELDGSLILAIPAGSHATIELLLKHGAKLKCASFHAAVAREDTDVFQLLIDSGWNIDSTMFNFTAVQ